MQVTVNGEDTELTADTTVADLVTARSGAHDRVAVALNGDVVPRSSWPETRISPGDALEVLAPTAGG